MTKGLSIRDKRPPQPALTVEVVNRVWSEKQRPTAGRFPASGIDGLFVMTDEELGPGAKRRQFGKEVIPVGFLSGHAQNQRGTAISCCGGLV